MKKSKWSMNEDEIANIMKPTNDYVFKRIFGHEGKENITKDLMILTDDFEFHIINLSKMKKMMKKNEIDKNDKLILWLRFLLNPKEIGGAEIMGNENLKEAKELLEEISGDEHEQELAEMRMKYIRDQKSIRKSGYNDGVRVGTARGIKQGKQIGMEQGQKQKQIEIAKKMLNKKISLEEITEFTGLTKEEIEQLK